MLEGVDWATIIIGAIIGVVLSILTSVIIKAVRAVFNIRKVPTKYHKVLAHTWRHYYFNLTDRGETKFFSEEEWIIRKTWYGTFKVNVLNKFDHSKYIGGIEYENGYLLFELKNDDEKLFLRCPVLGLNEDLNM